MTRALAVLAVALTLVGMRLAAGSFAWLPGWLYLLGVAVGLRAHGAYVARRNPELQAHRERIAPGTKRWDVGWLAVFWALVLAAPVVAAREWRDERTTLPWPLVVPGAGLQALGLALSARAMAVNPFFEGTVRIQKERGQRVIDVGPYAVIRHPGYAGLALWALGASLVLQSRRALLLAAVTCVWLGVRTVLEDRTLQRELPGYSEYVRRTRSRWVPHVW